MVKQSFGWISRTFVFFQSSRVWSEKYMVFKTRCKKCKTHCNLHGFSASRGLNSVFLKPKIEHLMWQVGWNLATETCRNLSRHVSGPFCKNRPSRGYSGLPKQSPGPIFWNLVFFQWIKSSLVGNIQGFKTLSESEGVQNAGKIAVYVEHVKTHGILRSAGVARSGGEGYGEGYPPPPPRDWRTASLHTCLPDVNSHRYAGQHIREASALIGFGRHKVWQIASEQA